MKINKLFRSFFFGKKDLIAAFEFGVNLSEVMKGMEKPLTKEIVERAEHILVEEISIKSHNRFVLDSIPNILAAIEPK